MLTQTYQPPSAFARAGVPWLPVLFALIYLLFPALEAAHLAEFHAAPLAAAPIAFALLFLERRQWRRFVLAALLVAAVKEEMALVGEAQHDADECHFLFDGGDEQGNEHEAPPLAAFDRSAKAMGAAASGLPAWNSTRCALPRPRRGQKTGKLTTPYERRH